jgi:hypothetical protein
MRAVLCTITTVLFLACLSPAQTSSEGAERGRAVPFQVSILTPPTAFRSDGQWRLCYEIYVNNLSPYSWTVQSIEAKSDKGAALLNVSGASLEKVLFHPAIARDKKGGSVADIAPGESVVAFLWIDLPADTPTPAGLQHEFTLKKPGDPNLFVLAAANTVVSTRLPEIVSPLHGKNWVAGNGPSNTSGHRRALIEVDGTPHISQRYAIDWVQIGDDNQTYAGDSKDNHSYHCFGQEARSIADAVVVEVKDGIPENMPRSGKMAVPITLETVAGNHVNLDLGGGVYAMYAHLQPGSIRVKLGDKVTVGQVIGLVGNTGNSTEPHLHFQLMNQNSPLGSDGIPYALPSYKLTGKISGDDETQPKLDHLPVPQTRHGEIPVEDEVVDLE